VLSKFPGNECSVVLLTEISLKEGKALESEDGKKGKGKAISVTGRGGPWGFETSRLPHFLDNRLTDSSEVVSLTHRPSLTPREDYW
jgi:hypothetical protein